MCFILHPQKHNCSLYQMDVAAREEQWEKSYLNVWSWYYFHGEFVVLFIPALIVGLWQFKFWNSKMTSILYSTTDNLISAWFYCQFSVQIKSMMKQTKDPQIWFNFCNHWWLRQENCLRTKKISKKKKGEIVQFIP